METFLSLISILIAAGSLVVSIISFCLGYRNQKRIVEIEEQRERDRINAARKAQLRAELRKTGDSWRLYVINDGDAVARNITLRIDEKPLQEHCARVVGEDLPREIGPHSEVSCLLAIAAGCVPPFRILLRWDDDTGTNRTYEGFLTS